MTRANQAREITKEERKLLAEFLAKEAFGADFLDTDLATVQEAVDQSSIVVCSTYYPHADLITILWAKEWSRLPNHPEYFRLKGSKVSRSAFVGRRIYTRYG